MKNKDEFEKFVKEKEIKNVLIGNGFGLSHPKLKDAFKWNMYEAFHKCWEEILPDKSLDCPESDLGMIRKSIIRKVLEFYVKKLYQGKSDVDNQKLSELQDICYSGFIHCNDFLKNYGKKYINIFTLNYDPVMYLQVLHSGDNFYDGFIGETYLAQDKIVKRLKEGDDNKTRVLFMHGSWFIQYNEKEELRKLSFNRGKSNHTIDDLFSGENNPFLILEDRADMKKALCTASSEIYFKHCYDQLKKAEGELLVFGVSFNNDDHILEALNESNFSKIYITHIGCDAPDKLRDKVSEKIKKDFEFVPIEENVIWKNIMNEKK